ncbi:MULTISPECIES: hypothetical protein [Eisenbergiella]|uniref:Uncharacterized protein n=1 Tax=Eisenbergiella porci TaxID=2652274 RepID=A0A6N7WCH6_9FIRM|nr:MULTISPECIES: hypothetical protein [Eisenbergiella]MDY2653575.1 hypothetical protein [Eisenbergiella porci]MSS87188.1 hypothetical protein [Eisenbergiella porci]
MKFKKMKGIMLGIVLFTMSSLTVTAAPMVQAPFTAAQLVDQSKTALAGDSSYHVESVESIEMTFFLTPQVNFFHSITTQLTANPFCIYYQAVESTTTGGNTEAASLERYTAFEGNIMKEYTSKNNLQWMLKSRRAKQGVTGFSMQDSFTLLISSPGLTGIPVYTDGTVYQYTLSSDDVAQIYTFDAASMLLISIHGVIPGKNDGIQNITNRLDYVITYNMYDAFGVPAEIAGAAIPVS